MPDRATKSELAQKIWSGESAQDSEKSGSGTPEENVGILRRYFDEVWNQGKLELAGEFLSNDYQDHGLPPGTAPGLKSYLENVNVFRTAFPDIRFTLDQVLAEADRVAMRLSVSGTHRGTFIGIPATNKEVSFSGMAFVRLEDGKVAERWGIMDMPSVMRQLGVGPK